MENEIYKDKNIYIYKDENIYIKETSNGYFVVKVFDDGESCSASFEVNDPTYFLELSESFRKAAVIYLVKILEKKT